MRLLSKIGLAGALAAVVTIASAQNVGPHSADVERISQAMQADHQEVLRLKATATKEKDIIRVNCLNDRLVEMMPQMNVADSVATRLLAATEPEPIVLAEFETAAQKVHEQRELAQQCVEQKVLGSESSSTFSGPEVETPTDPYPIPEGEPYVEPPAYASPDR